MTSQNQIPIHYCVGYLSQYSTKDGSALSGTNNTIYRALSKEITTLDISGLKQHPSIPGQILNKISRFLPQIQTSLPYHTWHNINKISSQLNLKLKNYVIDSAICPSSIIAAACGQLGHNGRISATYIYSDATVKSLAGYYPEWKHISRKSLQEAISVELFAFNYAKKIAMASEWAANSAINEYHIPANKLIVIPRSANLKNNQPPKTQQEINKRQARCQLITIGRDWTRKRIDICCDVTEVLSARGLPIKLVIIGLDARKHRSPLPENIISYQSLSKQNDAELKLFSSLMDQSSIFLFPSQAEAMGISLTEACAFSLPIVACDTGGVNTVVRDEINGLLAPPNSTPLHYADLIEKILLDPYIYNFMSEQSYQAYQANFNSADLGKKLMQAFDLRQ